MVCCNRSVLLFDFDCTFYILQNAWRAYPWPLMRKRSSVPIALPGWRLAMVGEPIGRSSLGCGGETARCFFGLFGSGNDREYYGNDGGQGRPPFYSPPPLQPGGMGMGPGMMGGYYGGGGYDEDEDYVEICDEFYDPLHDEYIEDCNTIPDYYK